MRPVRKASNPSIRPYRSSDRRVLGELFSDPDVMRFVGDGDPIPENTEPHLIERILEKYRIDPSFHIWAIEEGGRYAGHAELKRRAGRTEYELIYILARDCWGRGLGRAVVDLLLAEARNRDIPFVIATVDAENHASNAILRSHGFMRDENLSAELGAPAFKLVLLTPR